MLGIGSERDHRSWAILRGRSEGISRWKPLSTGFIETLGTLGSRIFGDSALHPFPNQLLYERGCSRRDGCTDSRSVTGRGSEHQKRNQEPRTGYTLDPPQQRPRTLRRRRSPFGTARLRQAVQTRRQRSFQNCADVARDHRQRAGVVRLGGRRGVDYRRLADVRAPVHHTPLWGGRFYSDAVRAPGCRSVHRYCRRRVHGKVLVTDHHDLRRTTVPIQ